MIKRGGNAKNDDKMMKSGVKCWINERGPSFATYLILTDGDKSNFFIGIPFSIDNDYQGRMSSPSSSILFKVTGQANATDDEICPRHAPALGGWF
jgi:hypothetical protein